MKLLLTSSGFSDESAFNVLSESISHLVNPRMVVLYTIKEPGDEIWLANYEKELNPLGISYDFINISEEKDLSDKNFYDIYYVAGGNTFYILDRLKKTGTITKGKPEVTDIISFDSKWNEDNILNITASVEKYSEHPLAEAIVQKAHFKKITLEEAQNFLALEGVGVKASINNQEVYVHKPIKDEKNDINIKKLQEQGKTVVIIEVDNKKIGLLALSDTLKEEAIKAIEVLHFFFNIFHSSGINTPKNIFSCRKSVHECLFLCTIKLTSKFYPLEESMLFDLLHKHLTR
jgi:hypothetical protein